MRSLVIAGLMVLLIFSRGNAAPLGTEIASFDYDVVRFARDPARPRIYATTRNNSVIVIDTATVQVVTEIFVGSLPQGLDISEDGTRLYVACQGSTTSGIAVVDLDNLTSVSGLPTAAGVQEVVAGLGGRLYITAGTTIQQVSAADGAVQGTLSGYWTPNYYYVSGGILARTPDRRTLFNSYSGWLTKFDVSSATAAFGQQVSAGSSGLREVIISHDGTHLATGSAQSYNGIALIKTRDISGIEGRFTLAQGPKNGAFSPNDTRFYTVSDETYTYPGDSDRISIFDTTRFLAVASFDVSGTSGDLICDESGRRLYAAVTDFEGLPRVMVYDATGLVLAFTNSMVVAAHQDESFTFALTTSIPGVTYSASGLPAGLQLDPATGVISGTPTAAGIAFVAISATTALGDAASATLRLDVQTPFTVAIVGDGAVAPGGEGVSWRTVGSVFNLVATTNPGSQFVNWTGSLTTTSSRMVGYVKPKMTLQANFARVVDVTVSVAGPGATTPSGTIQRPEGQPLTVTATPGFGARFTGWSGTVTSTQNPLQIIVSAGLSVTANFEMIPIHALTMGAAGPGTITPSLLGTRGVSEGNTVVAWAYPNRGAIFTGWSGGATGMTNPLTFQVLAPTTIAANFESLTEYAGRFRGVVPPEGGEARFTTLDVSLGATGRFSGKLFHGGAHYPFTGQITGLSGAHVIIATGSTPAALTLLLAVRRAGDGMVLDATLTDGPRTVRFQGYRAARFTATRPTPFAGKYTFEIPAPASSSAMPVVGSGAGTVRISRTGAASFSGVLGDGTPFSAATPVTEFDHVILAAALYAGRGVLAGQIEFRDVPGESDFDAPVSWVRPAQPGAARYAAGFATAATLKGALYSVPPGAAVFAGSAGRVAFTGGNLPPTADTLFVFGEKNLVLPAPTDPNGLDCALTASSGVFSGSFLPIGGKTRRSFDGVILQKSGRAVGLHKGLTECGSVILTVDAR